MTSQSYSHVRINVHFDPLCPLAWRTDLWLREVRSVRPLHITWRFFSLETINRKEGVEPDYANGPGWAAQRTLALARQRGGNEGLEEVYLALGAAQHGRRETIRDPNGVRMALQKAGLDTSLVDQALADETTIRDVQTDHQEAVERYHAFGVPTVAFEGSNVGFYGPIIESVPRGEEAGQWWDQLEWALRQPNLFELKRDRATFRSEPIGG